MKRLLLSLLNKSFVLYIAVAVIAVGLTDAKLTQKERSFYLRYLFFNDTQNLKDGVVYFEYMTHLVPKDPGIWRDLGYCQFNLGEYADAVHSYQKAIALNPRNPIFFAELKTIADFLQKNH